MTTKNIPKNQDKLEKKPGEIFDDRYQIIKKLGSGGFGTVYEVSDKINKQNLAIKFVKVEPLQGGGLSVERFLVEKESFASLSINPYVIKLYDVFQDGENWCIVTELVSGGSLSEFNKRFFYMNESEIKLFYTRVCSALDDAHKLNIIHRDIKEGNIMLTKFGSPKLGDFGISYTDQSTQLAKDTKVGTPTHLDPQYFRWSKISSQGDVYQLGVCLYTSAVGEPPFWFHDASSQDRKNKWYRFQQCKVNPVRPSLINQNISIELENIILKSLDKNLSKRYKTMDEMKRDIEALGNNPHIKQFKMSNQWEKIEFSEKPSLWKKERNIIEVGTVNINSMKPAFVYTLLAMFISLLFAFMIMVIVNV